MLADHFGPELIELGEPKRITGDIVLCFKGSGEAHFRIQHACDRGGEPDDLSWCDVTLISDRSIDPRSAIDTNGTVRGPLLGIVNGHAEATYRHHTASWIRIIADADDDDEAVERCGAYSVTLRPAPP